MPITSRSLVRRTLALLGAGLVALLAIVGMTIWLGERAQTYFDQVIEARDARSAAVELRNAVLAAESSQRGFLLTGNEIYLAPYSTAETAAKRQLDQIKRILSPYKEADAPVQRLAEIIGEKFDEMDRTIALKRDRKDADALAVVQTNRGKALTDEANVFFSGLIRAADDRLTSGVAEQRSNAIWLRWVSILGGFVIVSVVGGAAAAVVRYTRELAAARDEVSALNAGLEERVTARTADLAQANDEIQRFAYIVTHDLRAPLVNIMGFTSELETSAQSLQALLDRPDAVGAANDPVVNQARHAATEELPEAIGFIRSSTRKMDNLISAILKLSREGRRSLWPERIDLATLVSDAAGAIQHQISEVNGAIDIAVSVPPLQQDKLSLEQVVGNILDNAVKYRAKDRPLRIGVTARVAPGDRIAIDIADNGRGIADQDRERVFELFRRAGVQDQPGEGIGLAYVRAVLRNLGGDVTVTSALNQGTTFHIVLPRTLQVPGGARTPAGAAPGSAPAAVSSPNVSVSSKSP